MASNPLLKFHQQLNLFDLTKIGVTDVEQYSHLIGLYDQSPKGVSSKKKITEKPSILERDFEYEQRKATSLLSPALIRKASRVANDSYDESDPNSKKTLLIEQEVFMYPGERENRIEETLLYLASQGRLNKDPSEMVTGVYFTLGQLMKELKRRGHSMSLQQLKEGINVLHKCNLEIEIKNPNGSISNFSGSRLSNLIVHTRNEWLNNDQAPEYTDQSCYCNLHPLATYEIQAGQHTIYDYQLQSKIKNETAKALLKRLTAKYTYAHPDKEYSTSAIKFLRSTDRGFIADSVRKNWQELKTALDELKSSDVDVLLHYELEDVRCKKNPNKVIDKTIRVWSSPSFRSFMLKANSLKPHKRDLVI